MILLLCLPLRGFEILDRWPPFPFLTFIFVRCLKCLSSSIFVAGGAAAEVGKKKILLMKGKEKEIPNVSFTFYRTVVFFFFFGYKLSMFGYRSFFFWFGGKGVGWGATLKRKLAPVYCGLRKLYVHKLWMWDTCNRVKSLIFLTPKLKDRCY